MIHIKIQPQFDTDIVIVGAGPAGAATAAHLAQAGLRVLLVDRQIFPRDKVCGDFVGPVAILELQRLGITSLADYKKSNIIRDAAVYLDGKNLLTNQIPAIHGLPAHGRVVPRKVLDQWIVNCARAKGAQILEGYSVHSYATDSTGVTLTLKSAGETRYLRTKLLIGADGSSSLIARIMRGHSTPEADRIIAVRAYFEGISGPSDQADLFFTGESFPGYYWLFPTSPTAANVGVGMVQETLPKTDEHLRELLLKLLVQDSALQSRLRNARMVGKIIGWPLSTYNPYLPIVDGRVLLIGDAAGLINSLNGEGIQYALLSGRWAAETIAASATQDDFSLVGLHSYARRVEEELRYDMALASMIVQLIRNRNINSLWLQMLRVIATRARNDPDYADITGGVLAGLVPASSVISVNVIQSTIEQAMFNLGLGALKHLWHGPAHLTQFGTDTIRSTLELSTMITQNPLEYTKWSVETVTRAVELANQFVRHQYIHPTSPPPAAVTARSPALRLSIP